MNSKKEVGLNALGHPVKRELNAFDHPVYKDLNKKSAGKPFFTPEGKLDCACFSLW